MFTRFKELQQKAFEYLKSSDGNLNYKYDYRTFMNPMSFICCVYDDILTYITGVYDHNGKLVDSRLTMSELGKTGEKEYKDITYGGVKVALVDTMNAIGYPLINRFLLTDYGAVYIYSSITINNVYLITNIRIYAKDAEHAQKIIDMLNEKCVIYKDNEDEQQLYMAVNASHGGLNLQKMDVKPFKTDLSKNYNDNLPYDKMTKLINSDDKELILLHGEPGTGKTSIIRQLVAENTNKKFIYFDFKILSSLANSTLFTFFNDNKNSILIIEDCEKLFTDRNNGNPFIDTMLNLTDGIMGEMFKIKFICTFNCPVSKIDKAVLRKGRLSLIYEFKKLSLEKTKALNPNATEPRTLADIYCEENNNNDKNNKIGFSI